MHPDKQEPGNTQLAAEPGCRGFHQARYDHLRSAGAETRHSHFSERQAERVARGMSITTASASTWISGRRLATCFPRALRWRCIRWTMEAIPRARTHSRCSTTLAWSNTTASAVTRNPQTPPPYHFELWLPTRRSAAFRRYEPLQIVGLFGFLAGHSESRMERLRPP